PVTSPPPTRAEICDRSRPFESYRSGDFNCCRKKRSRNETLATRAFPFKADASLMVARNPTPSKFATASLMRPRNRKLPSLGLTRDASLITSRREKREKNAIRRPKFFASRKLPPALVVPCAMVIPLSLRPLQGVTLTRPIFKDAPKRWRSSCWIRACVPCDCTYRLRARKTTAPKIDNPARKNRVRRANFFTRRRYSDHV